MYYLLFHAHIHVHTMFTNNKPMLATTMKTVTAAAIIDGFQLRPPKESTTFTTVLRYDNSSYFFSSCDVELLSVFWVMLIGG